MKRFVCGGIIATLLLWLLRKIKFRNITNYFKRGSVNG